MGEVRRWRAMRGARMAGGVRGEEGAWILDVGWCACSALLCLCSVLRSASSMGFPMVMMDGNGCCCASVYDEAGIGPIMHRNLILYFLFFMLSDFFSGLCCVEVATRNFTRCGASMHSEEK